LRCLGLSDGDEDKFMAKLLVDYPEDLGKVVEIVRKRKARATYEMTRRYPRI
jgi:hypothetical protein